MWEQKGGRGKGGWRIAHALPEFLLCSGQAGWRAERLFPLVPGWASDPTRWGGEGGVQGAASSLGSPEATGCSPTVKGEIETSHGLEERRGKRREREERLDNRREIEEERGERRGEDKERGERSDRVRSKRARWGQAAPLMVFTVAR